MTREDTYTYTARSALDPARVVTFTFRDHHLVVDAGAPLEQVERIVTSPEVRENEPDAENLEAIPWLKPLAVSAVERSYHPFSVSDVYAYSEDGGLLVSAWLRAGGLRVAPVAFRMAQVDNPTAARAFVEELGRRKEDAVRPGRYPGLLDYWATWVLGGIAVGISMTAWLRGKRKAST